MLRSETAHEGGSRQYVRAALLGLALTLVFHEYRSFAAIDTYNR